MKYPVGTVIVAAVITGIGGGVIRDLLAGRKPLFVLREEIYALWAAVAGVAVGLHLVDAPLMATVLATHRRVCVANAFRYLSLACSECKWATQAVHPGRTRSLCDLVQRVYRGSRLVHHMAY